MDEFKISLFKSEHGTKFPEFRALPAIESNRLKNELSKRFEINVLKFELELASMQQYYEQYNSLKEFELINTLRDIGIKPRKKIFINWYRFERVDAIDIHDLNLYFYDIWFPSSDDIDLFDESLDWIISIRHDGVISCLKYKKEIRQ
jgi:hypothetical protein